MTVRGLSLALAVLTSAPAEAAACHRYSRWYYPWPQTCRVKAPLAYARASRPLVKAVVEPPDRDIPLPALARDDCLGGEADETTRGRLMLRAAFDRQ